RPQIAVQKRRRARRQKRRKRFDHTFAIALQLAAESVLRRECKLREQSLLTKKCAPIVGPSIALRRSADPIVATPAESLAIRAARRFRAMERGECAAHRGAFARSRRIQPFERQDSDVAVTYLRRNLRNANHARCGERPQSVALTIQHRRMARRRNFYVMANASG